MPDDLLAGVDSAAAAAQQGAITSETSPGAGPAAGEASAPAAGEPGQARDPAGPEPGRFDSRTEQAFAKRLASARAKLRQELAAQGGAASAPGVLPDAGAVANLAAQLGVPPAAARVMIEQQLALHDLQDREAQGMARAEVARLRQANPYLPDFDASQVAAVRQAYYRQSGVALPWLDAYALHLASEALAGRLGSQAEQQAIARITGRDRATVQAGQGGSAKAPDIWDMPQADFDALVERAIAGDYKRSP